MVLIQLLLPLYDNDGNVFPREQFDDVRRGVADKFGGVTAYARSPAKGLWKDEDGTVMRDDVVMYEVMAAEIDRFWWRAYQAELMKAFAQEELLIRALECERL